MTATSVLVVEDESIVALDLKLALQELGYAVAGIAASGERAVQCVDAQTPDLVLMDVRLQGEMDGVDTAHAIRQRHDVPVIFLTSHSDADTVRRAAQTAPYGYLTKPYQLKELRAGIEVALTKAQMERQLRQADRWFAHTLQCVADGVVVTGGDGRVRFLNPAAERLTGWSSDEAVGQAVGDMVRFVPAHAGMRAGPGSRLPVPDADAVVRGVLHDGRARAVAHGLVLLSRDGSTCAVDETVGPIDDDRGERLGAVLVLRDATARMVHESRLRASEERFRNAFDFAPLGMALVSLGGEFIQVNDAMCRLLGGNADLLRAHGHQLLTRECDREHEVQRLSELLGQAHGVVQYEKHYLRLDGREPVPTLASVSLLHEGELPTCWLFQVHDLSEQKRAAEQLAELADERLRREAIELAGAARTEFLSRASHEMRTPLNAVIGFAQLLQLQQVVDAETVGLYAQHIRAAGEHLLVLVEDLLDLHGAARGTLKMNLVAVPLAVGVPVMAPVEAFSVAQAGREPLLIAKL